MRRTFIITLMLALSLSLFAGCGPESSGTADNDRQANAAGETAADTPSPVDEPTPAPTAIATEKPADAPTETTAEEASSKADSETGEIVGDMQQLDWGADRENCIIPDLVISGLVGSDVPCSPIDVGNQPADESEQAGDAAAGTSSDLDAAGAEEPVQNAQATEATTLAVQDLAQQLGVAEEQITVCDVCEVTWPDSSMGCPQPDMMYAQMVQEGYLIQMTVGDDNYFYHSGGMLAPFLCEETMQNLPDGVGQ